jgi:selenocysteine lyase/cysteine desulfurase
MEAVVVPAPDAPALAARLFERHRVEVPAYWWNGLSILRLAVQAYNTEADVEALVAALARELGHDATRAAALGG